MTVQKNRGFTLVEMLVVIAIIAVLAAALFPAIQSAIESARATAAKQKGRGIWVAITSANTDREILDLCLLWPGDLIDNQKGGLTTGSTAENYFEYLMSNGDGKIDWSTPPERLVSDLKPESIASGVTALENGKTALGDNNNAWHVVVVRESDAGEVPFLITRNAKMDNLAYSSEDDLKDWEASKKLDLDREVKPFNGKLAVWVTKGGATLDAKQIYMKVGKLCPVLPPSDTAKLESLLATTKKTQ